MGPARPVYVVLRQQPRLPPPQPVPIRPVVQFAPPPRPVILTRPDNKQAYAPYNRQPPAPAQPQLDDLVDDYSDYDELIDQPEQVTSSETLAQLEEADQMAAVEDELPLEDSEAVQAGGQSTAEQHQQQQQVHSSSMLSSILASKSNRRNNNNNFGINNSERRPMKIKIRRRITTTKVSRTTTRPTDSPTTPAAETSVTPVVIAAVANGSPSIDSNSQVVNLTQEEQQSPAEQADSQSKAAPSKASELAQTVDSPEKVTTS